MQMRRGGEVTSLRVDYLTLKTTFIIQPQQPLLSILSCCHSLSAILITLLQSSPILNAPLQLPLTNNCPETTLHSPQ